MFVKIKNLLLILIPFLITSTGLSQNYYLGVGGNEIITAVNIYYQAGNYKTVRQAEDYSSGIYFYRIEAGKFKNVKELVLIKQSFF